MVEGWLEEEYQVKDDKNRKQNNVEKCELERTGGYHTKKKDGWQTTLRLFDKALKITLFHSNLKSYNMYLESIYIHTCVYVYIYGK